MNPRAVYLDYHATTPVDPRVLEAMLPYFTERFGNAASRQHRFGWIAEEAVENARTAVAAFLGAEARDIVFTSGATESNNLAIKGVAEAWKPKGNHIVTVATEHRSVLDTCGRLARLGWEVSLCPVDESGSVDPERIRDMLKPSTVLVSAMLANNEVGTIHDIARIGAVCRERGVLFHTDATQAPAALTLDVESMHVDLLSLSGHKAYGPKGIGVLYVRSAHPKARLAMQMDGGGHERGIRSGTLNVPGIVGLAAALDLCARERGSESARLARLRDALWNRLRSDLDDVILNGHPANRLPNNLNASFLRVDNSALMMSMKEIAVSTGSACSSADPEPSHVLKAMRLPPDRLHSAIRFGLGRFTTESDIETAAGRVVECVAALRRLSPARSSTHANAEP